MILRDLQRNWNELGNLDPLHSILALRDRNGSEWNLEEFFATGRREIDLVMDHVESLGVSVRRGRALDFGCGVGRLTQALATHFDEVWGVDIAPSMIELAQKYDRHSDKCRYCVNPHPDLQLFADETFDFIYTNITLQHMEPRYSRAYITEFLRVLAPHGLLVFQQPDLHPRNLKGFLIRIIPLSVLNVYRGIIYRVAYAGRPMTEMHWLRRADVLELLAENRAIVLDVEQGNRTGVGWLSLRYYVRKSERRPPDRLN